MDIIYDDPQSSLSSLECEKIQHAKSNEEPKETRSFYAAYGKSITLEKQHIKSTIKAVTCDYNDKQWRDGINWWGENCTHCKTLTKVRKHFEQDLRAIPSAAFLDLQTMRQAFKSFFKCGGKELFLDNIKRKLEKESNSPSRTTELIQDLINVMMNVVDSSHGNGEPEPILSMRDLVGQEMGICEGLAKWMREQPTQNTSEFCVPLASNDPPCVETDADRRNLAVLIRHSLTNQLIRQDVGLWLLMIFTEMKSHGKNRKNGQYRFFSFPEAPFIAVQGEKAKLPDFCNKTQRRNLSSSSNVCVFVKRETVVVGIPNLDKSQAPISQPKSSYKEPEDGMREKESNGPIRNAFFFTHIFKGKIELKECTSDHYVFFPRYIGISESDGNSEDFLTNTARFIASEDSVMSIPGFPLEAEKLHRKVLNALPQLENLGPISDALVGRQSWGSLAVQTEIFQMVRRCETGEIEEWLAAWRANARDEFRKQLAELQRVIENIVVRG